MVINLLAYKQLAAKRKLKDSRGQTMRAIKETPQLRMIRQWYERISRGAQPTQDELRSHFRTYADQAEILVRRVKDGQPWEDFVMGLDGAPEPLRQRLSRHFIEPRG